MVESENITGAINAHERAVEANMQALNLNSNPLRDQRASPNVISPRMTGSKMYKDYQMREGIPEGSAIGSPDSRHTTGLMSSQSRAGQQSRSTTEEKAARAKLLKERALAGEDSFRDF